MENREYQGGSSSSFVERMAEKMSIAANASRIYGEPVEQNGVTVIPVSKAMYGFGGGAGRKAEEEGSGGGGGMVLTPIGYIEITQGGTRFRTIRDPQTLIRIIAVSGVAALLITRSITKIFRK